MKAQSIRDNSYSVVVDNEHAYQQGYELSLGGDHWNVVCGVGDFDSEAVFEFLAGCRAAAEDAEKNDPPVMPKHFWGSIISVFSF